MTGWLLEDVVGIDWLTSIWVAALLRDHAAIVVRLLIKTVSFSRRLSGPAAR